jgi:hypothetical protein
MYIKTYKKLMVYFNCWGLPTVVKEEAINAFAIRIVGS